MEHQITKLKIGFILIIFILAAALSGCYYDVEEELYPGISECDTSNVTYSSTIAPIMELSNCNGCHSGPAPNAGLKTDNYNDLAAIANSGRLWGAINRQSGFTPMPQNQPKLSDCNLAKIRKWIDIGAPNN